MKGIKFHVDRQTVGGSYDSAYLESEEPTGEDIVRGVIQNIGTDLDVTIGGVTLFLAAWEDPEHWSEDIAEQLECSPSETLEKIMEIVAGAVEDS